MGPFSFFSELFLSESIATSPLHGLEALGISLCLDILPLMGDGNLRSYASHFSNMDKAGCSLHESEWIEDLSHFFLLKFISYIKPTKTGPSDLSLLVH